MNHTELQNLKFDPLYFCDEVREGFFVPAMMKRYWACQLKVIKEIDRVCKKYDIPWYADCGTLLGAVRHKGFIPWDDDMDICMMRHDYIRFFEVAEDEFPKEYWIRNPLKEKGNEEPIGKIISSHTINFKEEHLKEYYGCPYAVGIDVFPLDGLSDDEIIEERRRENIKNIWDAKNLVDDGMLDTDICRKLLAEIERQNHTILHRRGDLKSELLFLEWKVFCKYPSDKAKNVAMMPFWAAGRGHKYSKDLFKGTVLLPFENTYIPVPSQYEEVLHIEYGNYMAIRKDGGIHRYPVYVDQEEILLESNNENLYRYTMTKDIVLPVREDNSLSHQCSEIINMLSEVHDQIKKLMNTENAAVILKLLEGCQNLAINLGTLLEKRVKDSEDTVHVLEEYCENVYRCSEGFTAEHIKSIEDSLESIRKRIEDLLKNRRKEILFLSFKASWWNSLEPIYRSLLLNEDIDIYVLSVPYLTGDGPSRIVGGVSDDKELLPNNVTVTDIEDYDFEQRYPDVIYTDYPYDGFCTSMKVPPFFNSDNLRNHTEKLIYVPPFECSEPENAEDRNNVTLKILIEQPAVVYADEIELRSEVFKKIYVDVLTSLSGNREYWEEKVKVRSLESYTNDNTILCGETLPEEWEKKTEGRKILVFRPSVSFILQFGNDALEKLKRSVEVIKESSDRIVCIFSPDSEMNRIETINNELWDNYTAFIRLIEKDDLLIYDDCKMIDGRIDRIDAYYGSAGSLAHSCRNAGKPVMIMNITM